MVRSYHNNTCIKYNSAIKFSVRRFLRNVKADNKYHNYYRINSYICTYPIFSLEHFYVNRRMIISLHPNDKLSHIG